MSTTRTKKITTYADLLDKVNAEHSAEQKVAHDRLAHARTDLARERHDAEEAEQTLADLEAAHGKLLQGVLYPRGVRHRRGRSHSRRCPREGCAATRGQGRGASKTSRH